VDVDVMDAPASACALLSSVGPGPPVCRQQTAAPSLVWFLSVRWAWIRGFELGQVHFTCLVSPFKSKKLMDLP